MARQGKIVFGDPPPTKTCPACLSDDLNPAATRCKHCGSDIGRARYHVGFFNFIVCHLIPRMRARISARRTDQLRNSNQQGSSWPTIEGRKDARTDSSYLADQVIE
jgi:hypothetical protein